MRNRLKRAQNADWRCAAMPSCRPGSRSICLDFVSCAAFTQKLGHSDAAVPHNSAHLVYTDCAAEPSPLTARRSFSPDSSSPPYLSQCLFTGAQSTYSGYSFIHMLVGQTRRAAQIVNDIFLCPCVLAPGRLASSTRGHVLSPALAAGKMSHTVNFTHCTTPCRVGFHLEFIVFELLR